MDFYKDLDALPANLRIYGASDFATMEVGTNTDPDYTEHGIVGVCSKGDWWMLDWWFDQCTTDKGIKSFINLVRKWKPIRWWDEGGIIDKAIRPSKVAAMRASGAWTSLESLPSLQDKELKLMGFHARATAGTVHFPIRVRWADHVIDSLCKFPGAKHDDAPDVCGLFGRGIDRMPSANLQIPEDKLTVTPFTEAWFAQNEPKERTVRYFS